MTEPLAGSFICPRCAQIAWHPLEVYFRWCPKCQAVTGNPRQCIHESHVRVTQPWERIRENEDRCLIAIEGRNPLPVQALLALPPWRAVMLARVAQLAGTGLERGTCEQIEAEARSVTGTGQLGEWWARKEEPA